MNKQMKNRQVCLERQDGYSALACTLELKKDCVNMK